MANLMKHLPGFVRVKFNPACLQRPPVSTFVVNLVHTKATLVRANSRLAPISVTPTIKLRNLPEKITANLFHSTTINQSDSTPPSPQEERIIRVLSESFPSATDIAVVDVSGGCGAMYEVYVEAPDFKGIRMVKQHQMVTAALKKEIGEMHGIRISTQASAEK